MTKEDLLLDFFDFTKPCHESIPFCQELRDKYQHEIDKLKNSKTGCSACQKNKIKTEFIKRVWEKHIVNSL